MHNITVTLDEIASIIAKHVGCDQDQVLLKHRAAMSDGPGRHSPQAFSAECKTTMPRLTAHLASKRPAPSQGVTLHFEGGRVWNATVESEGHDLDGTRRVITDVGTVRWTDGKAWIFLRKSGGELVARNLLRVDFHASPATDTGDEDGESAVAHGSNEAPGSPSESR